MTASLAVPRSQLLALAALLGCASNAFAQTVQVDPLATPSIYLQGARAEYGTSTWTLGTTLPWNDWRRSFFGSEVRGYWDIYASQWAGNGPTGRTHTTVLGVTPSFRLTPDNGHARWFFDVGIGTTLANPRYVTLHKEFSTRLNFATHLGIGLALGKNRQHELQLRLEHVSNGGIKKPNPGENFLQLRYALHF